MNAHADVEAVSAISVWSPGASWTEGGSISNLTLLLLVHGY